MLVIEGCSDSSDKPAIHMRSENATSRREESCCRPKSCKRVAVSGESLRSPQEPWPTERCSSSSSSSSSSDSLSQENTHSFRSGHSLETLTSLNKEVKVSLFPSFFPAIRRQNSKLTLRASKTLLSLRKKGQKGGLTSLSREARVFKEYDWWTKMNH